MDIVIVAGPHSGVGKTRAAEVALFRLRGAGYAAIKLTVADEKRHAQARHGSSAARLASEAGVCGRGASCGVCETVSKDMPSRVITAPGAIGKVGTDTWRLAQAGALAVVWVIALRHAAPEALARACTILHGAGARGILIEGTSALDWIDAKLCVMVATDPGKAWKDVALRRINRCDIVLRNVMRRPPGTLPAPPEFTAMSPVACDLERPADMGTLWYARQIQERCGDSSVA